MQKVNFTHGGKEYDDKYPEGIPTSIKITLKNGTVLDSGFVMFPSGHARNTAADLNSILDHKFNLLGSLALEKNELNTFLKNLVNLENLSNKELHDIYTCNIRYSFASVDSKEYAHL